MENNENYELCKECGGICCKNYACYISPNEVIKRKNEITKEVILELLETGYVALDKWEGDVIEPEELYHVCFLRLRHKKESILCESWGGECVCLTDTGCMFNWEERPLCGKSLIPNRYDMCHETSYTKEDCVKEWRQYHEILDEIYDEIYDDDMLFNKYYDSNYKKVW